MMWHWLSLIKFINLTNEYLNYFFVISNITIGKLIVKFVVFLTSLKKNAQPLKNKYDFIKI